MSEVDSDKLDLSEAETDGQLDALIRNTPELAAAQDFGIDVHMLISNVNRTVSERIERHRIALDTFHKLRNARLL